MSHSRKHVVAGSLHDYPVPEGEQEIVRVTEMRGSNIVEVVRPSGEKILCLMPAKFKKTLWIKRGKPTPPLLSIQASFFCILKSHLNRSIFSSFLPCKSHRLIFLVLLLIIFLILLTINCSYIFRQLSYNRAL
jgi:hypothetical protein